MAKVFGMSTPVPTRIPRSRRLRTERQAGGVSRRNMEEFLNKKMGEQNQPPQKTMLRSKLQFLSSPPALTGPPVYPDDSPPLFTLAELVHFSERLYWRMTKEQYKTKKALDGEGDLLLAAEALQEDGAAAENERRKPDKSKAELFEIIQVPWNSRMIRAKVMKIDGPYMTIVSLENVPGGINIGTIQVILQSCNFKRILPKRMPIIRNPMVPGIEATASPMPSFWPQEGQDYDDKGVEFWPIEMLDYYGTDSQMKVAQKDGVISASLKETNRIRKKLNLKQLKPKMTDEDVRLAWFAELLETMAEDRRQIEDVDSMVDRSIQMDGFLNQEPSDGEGEEYLQREWNRHVTMALADSPKMAPRKRARGDAFPDE